MAGTVTYTPHPNAIAIEAEARSEKSEATAIEILKLAVASANGANGANLTDRQIVDRAELMWLWVTGDTWPTPAPDGAP